MVKPAGIYLRRSLLWLTVIALVLRGIIPVGYMPDFASAKSGPAMVICGGTVSGHMIMPGAGKKSPEAPATKQHDAPCPFSVNAVFSFDELKPPASEPFFLYVGLLVFTALILSVQPRFGNASSRGPPRFP